MRTEYDDDELPPPPPGKKRTKAERRAAATRKARSIPCGGCNHARPDHVSLSGRERTLFMWCPVCNHKCEKEKWNAKL